MPGDFKGTRGVAQAYIPELISEGMSNAQIVDFLRLNDLGYRNQNMYADINRIRLENFGALSLSNLETTESIPERLMRTWYGDTEYKYRVVIKYDYFDTQSLTMKNTGTTLYYNEAPTQDMVFDDWSIRKQTIESLYGTAQGAVEVRGATQFLYYKNTKG